MTSDPTNPAATRGNDEGNVSNRRVIGGGGKPEDSVVAEKLVALEGESMKTSSGL